ncbi:hypothetical protein [Sphingomonas sp. Leaf37]|uniref:hypothetical protein n=1 Tax=Sphingomonas sp. Leaf37 TaxID=2876552 RepID=UPI001E5C3E6F|nr:hypothetical protein [Sphingomonas sp. Leaf37]
MITGNATRLKAAQTLLLRFIEIGRNSDPKRRTALQRSPAGWPIARDPFARQIKARLDGQLPNQLETSYCGPAAFLYCLLHDRPDVYVTYALSLWERGHFRFGNRNATLTLSSDDGQVAAAKALTTVRAKDAGHRHIDDIDWMTMSCLSASTRPLDVGAVKPKDQFGSISYPGVVRKWFVAAGAGVRADTMGAGLMKSSMLATLSLMKQWTGSWIVLQIDSSLLQGGTTNTFTKRHWVVVDPHRRPMIRKGAGGPVVPLGDAAEELWKEPSGDIARGLQGVHMRDWDTNLSIVTWGDEHHAIHGRKLGQTIGRIYGGFAFSRFR